MAQICLAYNRNTRTSALPCSMDPKAGVGVGMVHGAASECMFLALNAYSSTLLVTLFDTIAAIGYRKV